MISNEIQEQLEQIGKNSFEIERQLTAQRNKLMKPIYSKRRDILKKVPNFWGTAMSNHDIISNLFGDVSNQDLLNHITDFHVEYDEENPDKYTVSATFSKNDHFENETLTKTITVSEEGETAEVEKATINWRNGKGPKTKKRKADDDDEPASLIEWFTDEDHILGSLLRDDFFPDAIRYYNGDEEDFDEDDEELEEIELGSEDEDEEDEEEEEEPKPKKARK